jgi:hypothetical protein
MNHEALAKPRAASPCEAESRFGETDLHGYFKLRSLAAGGGAV